MAESDEGSSSTGAPFFQHCCKGLEYAEDVLKTVCRNAVKTMHTDLQKSFKKIIKCICSSDSNEILSKGWKATFLEHQCTETPACNALVKGIVRKLPSAFRASWDTLLRTMFQNDVWELTKLFLEPWMWSLGDFENLDTFCLLVFLDNTCTVIQESLPKLNTPMSIQQAIFHERVRKLRDIAEACFRTDNEELKIEERDACLQATINMLALISRDKEADVAIENIINIKDTANTYLKLEGHAHRKRLQLQETKNAFERKVREFASDIPHEDPQALTIVQNRKTIAMSKTTYPEDHKEDLELLRMALNKNTFSIEDLLKGKISKPGPSGNCKTISIEEYELIQALLYSVEKSGCCDARDVINSIFVAKKLTDQENVEMPVAQFQAMQKALEGQGCGIQLQKMLCSEIKATHFKICHQSLLGLEDVLRQYCKNKVALMHTEVKNEFPRKMLCSAADRNDVVRVNRIPSEEIQFKHDCTENPECNTFLKTVLTKTSANCGLTPCTMFNNIDPQDCIDDIWTFTQLFLEPCMRNFKGLCDLDAYCLLTLFKNIRKEEAKQNELATLLGKTCKIRHDACNLLQCTNREMTREEMDCFLSDIIDILETGILPGAARVIQQINTYRSFAQIPNFESALAMESKRLHNIERFYKEGFIRERQFYEWCRIALTLDILQPALLPLVQKEINIQHQKTKTAFPGNLCLDAKAGDIRSAPGKSAKFAHTCHRKGLHCNTLLNEIRNITSENVNIYTMLKGSDPQSWLNTPLDFSHMFLKDWMRRVMKDFKEFDVSALCHIIIRCRPLFEKCNGDTDVKNVISVRNRTMHSTFDIEQQNAVNDIDAILKMLRHIEVQQKAREVTEAIQDIEQLKAEDLGLLKGEERLLIEGALLNLKHELEDKKALMTTLSMNKREKELLLEKSKTVTFDTLYARKEGDTFKTNIEVDQNVFFWIACALGLKYLRKGWMLLVQKEITKLHENTIRQFGGKLCSKATKEDISRSDTKRHHGAVFSHTNEGCNCNKIFDFLQEYIPESIDAFNMFRSGIDPQNWLRSHFDFAMIFIKKWKNVEIHEFKDCDISTLCAIVSRCKPLKEIMDSEAVRELRSEIVHSARMDMTLEQMTNNLRAMLEFVQQLRTVHDSHELAKSEENIRQIIEEGFTIRRYEYVQMLQNILSEIIVEISYTKELVDKLEQKYNMMEKAIWCLTSAGVYFGHLGGESEIRIPFPEMETLRHIHVNDGRQTIKPGWKDFALAYACVGGSVGPVGAAAGALAGVVVGRLVGAGDGFVFPGIVANYANSLAIATGNTANRVRDLAAAVLAGFRRRR